MANRYLTREDAPISEALWSVLDNAMVAIARSQLSGRRLLELEGPFGFGLKSVPLGDEPTKSGLVIGSNLPVALIERPFELGKRNLAAWEREPSSLDLQPLVEATLEAARLEDSLVFNGGPGITGLMDAPGRQQIDLSVWTEVGSGASDVIKAVTALDGAGFHGPYALALAPERYNTLLRVYPQGGLIELDHVRSIVQGGVVKAPSLASGGVLVAAGRPFASIILGQDVSVGFVGPTSLSLEFNVSESLTVRIRQPRAVCVLV